MRFCCAAYAHAAAASAAQAAGAASCCARAPMAAFLDAGNLASIFVAALGILAGLILVPVCVLVSLVPPVRWPW